MLQLESVIVQNFITQIKHNKRMQMKLLTKLTSIALIYIALFSPSSASAYSSIVAFGDSLSDNGNFNQILNPGYVGPPIRPSNGPVAVEVMANTLGVPLFDYAVTGAKTGLDVSSGRDNNIDIPALLGTGMTAQVSNYLAGKSSVGSNALYFIWGGPNDLGGYARSDYSIVANNITSMVTQLANKGATSFFIPNLIDMGLDPYFTGPDKVQQSQDSVFYNALFSKTIHDFSVANPTLNIQYFDYFTLQHSIIDNAPAGFNTTDACTLNTACVADPNIAKNYFFWDEFHPTATMHNVIGTQYANTALTAAVPEPETYALMLAGLGLVGFASRKRKVIKQA